MGLDLFLKSICLLMTATVYKVSVVCGVWCFVLFFHREYKEILLEASYLTICLLELGEVVGTGM